MRADMTFFGFSLIFSFGIDAREPRCASPGKSISRQSKSTNTCHNFFATRDEKKEERPTIYRNTCTGWDQREALIGEKESATLSGKRKARSKPFQTFHRFASFKSFQTVSM